VHIRFVKLSDTVLYLIDVRVESGDSRTGRVSL
jgi:hypothetical protein